jgi:hypothetical protein
MWLSLTTRSVFARFVHALVSEHTIDCEHTVVALDVMEPLIFAIVLANYLVSSETIMDR